MNKRVLDVGQCDLDDPETSRRLAKFLLMLLGLCALACLPAVLRADELAQRRLSQWHQWRGPRADGLAPQADPPVEWDQKTNVKWKVAIPGEGSATPIIWDDQVFILTAVKTDRPAEELPETDERSKTPVPKHVHEFVVLCLDRRDGGTRWRQVARAEVPHEGRHPTNSYASASPTTDGRRLVVSFGSRGVFCYDLDGKPLWKRDLGDMRTRYGWGEGTSPVLHGDSLIVNWDHEDQSFIAVLDANSGQTRWKVDRDEPTSWATPLVVERGGRTQVIVNGTNRVRSYDLSTGEVLWQCGGQTVNAIPSPVTTDRFVVCMSGYRGAAAYAIPLDAKGDLTDTDRIVWRHRQATPYVPSPIMLAGRIYFTAANSAVLSSLDLATGKPVLERQRLPGLRGLYASPVAAAGRLYITDRDGTTLVLRPGDRLEVLATNRLDDPMDASAAVVGGQIFLRSQGHLYCIERKAGKK